MRLEALGGDLGSAGDDLLGGLLLAGLLGRLLRRLGRGGDVGRADVDRLDLLRVLDVGLGLRDCVRARGRERVSLESKAGGRAREGGDALVTTSGRGLDGPRRPSGSQGFMILTLMPRTPWRMRTWRVAESTKSRTGWPEWIMKPSVNFIDLARAARSLPETMTSQPLAPDSMTKRRTP